MTKRKSLHELGEEYERAASQIKRVIAKKREELNGLRDCICSTEAFELKRELNLLYAQYRETSEIAGYLKQYYEPHGGCRELFSYK